MIIYTQNRYSRWKKIKKPEDDFGNYCSQLMKNSLITGFPVIAGSKSTLRRVVKTLVFLACTAGFFYQTYEFLEIYLEYPTVMNINELIPEVADIPAITICNNNRLRRQVFCKNDPSKCEWKNKTREDFCEVYPKFCRLDENDDDIVFGVPGLEFFLRPNRSLELLDVAGIRKEDFLHSCEIRSGQETRSCLNDTIVVTAAKKGLPNNCFSVKSMQKKPDGKPEEIPLTGSIYFQLQMQPEQYMIHKDVIQAYVHIHNPFGIANPQTEGLTLMAGNEYKIYIRKRYYKRLPSPYKMNCANYMKMWRANGGQGPITRKDCIERCKMDTMLDMYGCVGQSVTYPHSHRICETYTADPKMENITRCIRKCSVECEEEVYDTTVEEVKNILDNSCKNKTDENCRYQYLSFEVNFSLMEVTETVQRPKYESVELFSFIGGYMGMWLGLSLVSLFDFAETVVDVLAYPLIKWKNKDKKRARINNVLY